MGDEEELQVPEEWVARLSAPLKAFIKEELTPATLHAIEATVRSILRDELIERQWDVRARVDGSTVTICFYDVRVREGKIYE